MRLADRIVRQPNVRFGFASIFAWSAVAALVGLTAERAETAWLVAIPALALVTALVVAATPTATMDLRWLHAVPLFIILESGLSMTALVPEPAQAAPVFAFVGPAAAFLFGAWRPVIAHLALATVVMVGIGILGDVTTSSAMTIFGTSFVMCALAGATMTVWGHAERVARQLDELTRIDPVTGIGNRRLLDDRLAYELVRHSRSRQPLALAILDLNGFKTINDTMGHASGDDLLREAARRLTGSLRAQDSVARAGGDEFAVLAPATSREAAPALVQTLRDALAGVDADGTPLTAAIGVAVFPDDARDARTLYEAADAAQRQDKPDQRVR